MAVICSWKIIAGFFNLVIRLYSFFWLHLGFVHLQLDVYMDVVCGAFLQVFSDRIMRIGIADVFRHFNDIR